MGGLSKTIERLCEVSKNDYNNPYPYLQAWPRTLDPEQWFASPELISLYETPEYERLSDARKQRLSLYEAVNFFSLNIHGEKSLVEGLAKRLYEREKEEISPYLHHFLDEENKHMIYFAEFCIRYAGKIYPDKKVVFPRDYESGEEDFLFFAKVLIFEEIVDVYNVRMSMDETLAPVARQINALHHRDEARHLVFGRRLVTDLFHRYSPMWSAETLEGVRAYLKDYFVATWSEYYNPLVYQDAGLDDPWELREKAFRSPSGRRRRKKIAAGCVRYLLDNGILTEEPPL